MLRTCTLLLSKPRPPSHQLLGLRTHIDISLLRRSFSVPSLSSESIKMTDTENLKPAEPRLSASLVLVNSRNEILLVQRNPHATSFAGLHVFPGGNFDAKQDTSLRWTAIRETFEEAGLLLALSDTPSTLLDVDFTQAREATALLPFTTWVTPPSAARRFRTEFFVAFLRDSTSDGLSSGREEHLPTPDGGQEVIRTRFLRPELAIDEFRTGKINLFPPQYYILETLSPHPYWIDQCCLELRLGRMLHVNDGVDEAFVYEGDELRGGPKGRQHRMLVERKGALFSQMNLQRNFNLLTQCPVEVHIPKL
ncbi:NUDIX domain-containing protein [Suillus lakei]|nr:NUDIX domain-containing protein [Suillus lakei]